MPVIQIDKKYLYGLVGASIDDKKLADQLSKLGFEVESADKDHVSVEITANRLDLLDAVGLARTLKNFMHVSKRFHYEIEDAKPAIEIEVDRSVRKVRPYISSLVAYNLDISDESLTNMINFTEKFCETYGRDRRKIAMGFHDLDRIKPPIRYASSSDGSFIPLGGSKEYLFSDILKNHEKGMRYGSIIRDADMCYYPALSDAEGVMAFIPILNSERTKVTTNTRNLFVDITGTSEFAVNKTCDLLAASFMDLGADVKKVRIKYQSKKIDTPLLEKRYISIPIERMEREIGVAIGFNNIISLANKMGYEAGAVGKKITFRLPEYRLDIIDDQDVIEDIAIGYGYEYINPTPIYYFQPGRLDESTVKNLQLSDIMVGLGFCELVNSYLTNENDNFSKALIPEAQNAIRMKGSKTEYITMLRTWLIPSLLKDLSASLNEKTPQNVFEIDMAFRIKDGAAVESYKLAGVSIDPRANFNSMKSVVEGLLFAAGIKYELSEYSHNSFIEGRCASIAEKGKTIGFLGELHPKVLKNFGIEEPGTGFEIDLESFYSKR